MSWLARVPAGSAVRHEAPGDHAALAAQAREYLSAIRPYKVSHRPHGVLVREAAELRRFLGYALDALAAPTAAITALAPEGSATSLSPADALEVLGALSTAAEYPDYRASARCDDCAQLPGGRCESHADETATSASRNWWSSAASSG
jgi:hypothetical protein